LFPDCVASNSHNVRVAVEDKPADFNEKEGLREVVLQLVGLNVASDFHSPAVVLTNLGRTHFVLCFDLTSNAPLRFATRILKYEAFNLAFQRPLRWGIPESSLFYYEFWLSANSSIQFSSTKF
jgi:hypothetical protein